MMLPTRLPFTACAAALPGHVTTNTSAVASARLTRRRIDPPRTRTSHQRSRRTARVYHLSVGQSSAIGDTTMARMSRRKFVSRVAATSAGFAIVPRHVLGRGLTAPSDRLNVAAVGVGGQGRSNMVNLASENIVVLCDVDWEYADKG